MKIRCRSTQYGGITIRDVVALIVLLLVAGAIVMPMIAKSRARHGSGRISCAGTLKQISISFRVWANDHDGKLPMQVSTNFGGSKEFVGSGALYPHFLVTSNELSTPKILICWWDEGRKQVTTFATLKDTNISYFLGLDADPAVPSTWLVGDRNLATNGTPLRTGLINMPDGATWSWTRQQHDRKGYVCRADGSVSLTDGDGKGQVTIPLQQSVTNALQSYFAATTNTSFRLAIP
jgi:hypothetical protein